MKPEPFNPSLSWEKFVGIEGFIFHTDAVQWFGKEPFENIHQFNADLVSVCAHKFHGPKGAGRLFIKSPLLPDPILFGGGHENERRAGTENLPAIIGFTDRSGTIYSKRLFSTGKNLAPLSNDLIAFHSLHRWRAPFAALVPIA